MSSTPKHRTISRELAAQINSGKYPDGARLPSEMQLVSRFGVSRPTVIRALRDLQDQGLIERRAGSGSYARIGHGSSSLRWVRDALCDPERAEAARRGIDAYVVMEEAAASVPAGANGLLAIFSNVMDVKRWVQAPPAFVGFDVGDPARTDRRACIRAVQEQAAFATRGHLSIIRELTGETVDSIVFTGGAAHGQLWPHIVADVLDVTVQVPAVKESTALGAAMFAGLGAGLYPDLETVARSMTRVERTIEPDPANRGAYDDAFGRWSAVYPRMLALAEDGLATPMWWPAGA